jgi:hypothetical protein
MWSCPGCGGEVLDENATVREGCIAEEVAIIFESDEKDQDDDET